jgi:hypothetical protein
MGFWARHPTAEARLLDKLADGKTRFTIATELSAEFNELISNDAVSHKTARMGRPPLREGVISKATVARGQDRSFLFWGRNPDALNIVREKAEKGDSAEQIAAHLTNVYNEVITKNAVLGKIHRLKGTVRNIVKEKRVVVKSVRKVSPPALKIEEIIIKLEPLSLAVWDLKNRSCRWIIDGDPGVDIFAVRYCGITTELGKSFCLHHREIGEQPTKRSVNQRPFYRGKMLR